MAEADPATTRRLNPYSLALTGLWSALLALALPFLAVGASAGRADPAMEEPPTLGAVCTACSGVCAAVAVIVDAVQLGVHALRWHLDPTTRPRSGLGRSRDRGSGTTSDRRPG